MSKLPIDEWYRREEQSAKLRHDTGNPNIWDFGVGKNLLAIAPDEAIREIVKVAIEADDGLTVVAAKNGTQIYIFRDSKRRLIEIGTRADVIDLCGEKMMAEIDAIISKGE